MSKIDEIREGAENTKKLYMERGFSVRVQEGLIKHTYQDIPNLCNALDYAIKEMTGWGDDIDNPRLAKIDQILEGKK